MCQECLLKDLGAGQDKCEKHGKNHIDWKCQYCCSVALFHCFGTNYFCEPCHTEFCSRGGQVELKCCGGKNCPLGVDHPPADIDYRKSVYPLGCGLCRTEKLEARKNKMKIEEVKTEEAFVPKPWERPQPQPRAAPERRVQNPPREQPDPEMPDWMIEQDEEEDEEPAPREAPQVFNYERAEDIEIEGIAELFAEHEEPLNDENVEAIEDFLQEMKDNEQNP